MSADVTNFIEKINQPWQTPICTQLRQMLLATIPNVVERLQYGKPHYLKDGKYAAVFATAKGWVSLTIFNAQDLTPPDGMFEASEKGDRITIKIKPEQTVDEALLTALVAQAVSTL
jgi:hypothetical protein